MRVDHTRDEKLTDFGKATLKDRYLMEGESYQDMFARVAKHYSNDEAHAQRIYDYISNLWFMPATPVLSNGGNSRGLPISCFLSEATDNMHGIVDTWNENIWLACKGGGIGSYWGNIRAIGERVGGVGKSSGVIPFLKVQDALTLAISQGSLRRGSAAIYLPVWHPEIEEFIGIRRPTGGDPERKTLNSHHGVVLDNKFMEAVVADGDYELLSPKDGSVVEKVKARDIWIRILTARLETGEPYIMWSDTVNEAAPQHHKDLGLKIKMSNLCSEITLPTGIDQHGEMRTAVCCLSSLNLETYDEWKNDENFILDVMYFLDNVLQDFIDNAPDTHAKARYSAARERSIGLGVMGLHAYYQSKMIAWESDEAKEINETIFRRIQMMTNEANQIIGMDRGGCLDAVEAGYPNRRFSNCTAIAPTASISVICGSTSPGIEPFMANVYVQKTLSGSFTLRNPHLTKLLESKGKNIPEVWMQIANNEGSVDELDFLTEEERLVFRTALEIDPMDIITHAAARQPYIDQSQSVNLFVKPDVSKRFLNMIHMRAWELGLKTLYYCRSESLAKADKPSQKVDRQVIDELKPVGSDCLDGVCAMPIPKPKYDECEACQ